MYTTQAQRLKTIELEEKVVWLERELEVMAMESRVQRGYIANLKVFEKTMGCYIWRLKERLQEVDPKSQLLEAPIPRMPERGQGSSDEGEGLTLLSDVVDGMSQEVSY